MMPLLALQQGLSQWKLDLSDEQMNALSCYLTLLDKWSQIYNLTAVRDGSRMVSYHVLDSLSLVPYLEGGGRMLDVGSGGGMPGIPIAIARPDLQVVLLDASHKKTTFLRQVVLELGLCNVEVMTLRVEAFHAPQKFDYITSRAFAGLADFVKMTSHLLADSGQYIAMKGVYPYAEIALLPQEVVVSEVWSVVIPNLGAERHLVRLRLKGGGVQ